MAELPKPPAAFREFITRYPDLGHAWESMRQEGENGPLDDRTARLVKLGIAIGAMREGAVHSGVRKALALDVEPAAIEQVVALAAGTIGLPSAVAVFSWIRDVIPGQGS